MSCTQSYAITCGESCKACSCRAPAELGYCLWTDKEASAHMRRKARVSTLQAPQELRLAEQAFLVSGRVQAGTGGGIAGPSILDCPPSSYQCTETARVSLGTV